MLQCRSNKVNHTCVNLSGPQVNIPQIDFMYTPFDDIKPNYIINVCVKI